MTFDYDTEVQAFAQEVQDLVEATLPVPAGADPRKWRIGAVASGSYVAVHPHDDAKPESATKLTTIPLLCSGEPVASLGLSYHCTVDSENEFIAVQKSKFELNAMGTEQRTPLLRLDYARDAYNAPAAHWNVHAERGAVSHLLARTNSHHHGLLSKVHLTVGGARHRPCLEDFLQMLFTEFRFDHCDSYRRAIQEGRERWRKIQIRTLVRDSPETAADQLVKLGYTVSPPDEGPRATNTESLRRY